MTLADQTAVVLADVHMTETIAQRMDRDSNILLLDIGVEGIDGHADPGMTDGFAQCQGFSRCAQEKSLGAIHGLNGERDAACIKSFAERLKYLGCPLPLARRRPMAGEIAIGAYSGPPNSFAPS